MLDIKNKKFGKLTVLEFAYINDYSHAVWKCKCECGRETLAQTRFLNDGSKVSCGCKRKLRGNKHPTWKGTGELSLRKYNSIKNNAETRNIFFNLSIDYLWNLAERQNKKCALSGETLNFIDEKLNSGNASLDRIDSSGDYVEGNVQWTTKDINLMKRDFSIKKFKTLIENIYKCYIQHSI